MMILQDQSFINVTYTAMLRNVPAPFFSAPATRNCCADYQIDDSKEFCPRNHLFMLKAEAASRNFCHSQKTNKIEKLEIELKATLCSSFSSIKFLPYFFSWLLRQFTTRIKNQLNLLPFAIHLL